MIKKNLVLIGNRMAGIRTIEEILYIAPDLYNITVFGKEPHQNYNRIQLSNILQGEMEMKDIIMNDWDWYRDNKIKLYTDDAIVEIDTTAKCVKSANGITASFDELIIATGSNPFILPIPGAEKEGVIGFRDMKDCQQMIEASSVYKHAAVIGGGLLGLEAAKGLGFSGHQ